MRSIAEGLVAHDKPLPHEWWRKLAVNAAEADVLKGIFERFLHLGSVRALVADLRRRNIVSKRWKTRRGHQRGGRPFARGALYYLLRNRIYLGEIEHKGAIHKGEHQAILSKSLWDRVQAKLDASRGQRSAAPRMTGSTTHLLTRLVYDDKGNRMTPSHVRKRDGRRHRYYVSQAMLQHRSGGAGSLARVPAQAIEDLVLDRLRRILPKDARLETQDGRRSTLLDTIDRIEVAWQQVKIGIKGAIETEIDTVRARMAQTDHVESANRGIAITIPIRLKSWGGETVIDGANGESAYPNAKFDHALVNALARVHRWRQAIETGSMKSIDAIAASAGHTDAYVRKLLPLAFLAPDITERILDGTQPRHITVDRLVRMKLPLSWTAQRRVLGLTA